MTLYSNIIYVPPKFGYNVLYNKLFLCKYYQDGKYTLQHYDSLWTKIWPLLSQVSWTNALF